MLLALAHGLAYALITPLWQTPDEPMLYEYAALSAELGRPPGAADHSPAVEARLLAALGRAGTWGEQPAPASLEELERRFDMPRQVGGDPPLYFALAGAALRLAPDLTVEGQVRLLRALNAGLLPLAVLCAYLAGRRLLRPYPPAFALLPAAIVALHPMAAYTGAGLGNDALANALGALLCLLLLRALARPRPGRLIALALVAALALLVKRSALPYALLAAGLLALYTPAGILRAARRSPWQGWAAGLALAAALAAGGAWLAAQFDGAAAAGWQDGRGAPAPRTALADGPALLLRAGDELIQPLPARATAALRNGALRFGARVWSDGPASGRLVVYTGDRRQERAFQIAPGASVELGAYVPTIAPDVRIGVVADSGWFYADGIWGRAAGLPGEIVANGGLDAPALRPESPLRAVVRYLRLEDLAWATASGRPAQGIAPLDWARWIFVSFWGQFGWLDLPMVRDSLWEPLISLACAVGLAGCLLALLRPHTPPDLRRGLAVLLAAQIVGLLVLLINSVADPGPPPQGRYLLPLLAPLALMLTVGAAALAPARRPGLWLAGWGLLWTTFAAAALLRVAAHYR
jgi:hypothetical protein